MKTAINIFMIAVLLAMLWLWLATTRGNAHSWYPYSCCSATDCAPVDKVEIVPFNLAGVFSQFQSPLPTVTIVTTRHGKAVLPPNKPRQDSRDQNMHVCLKCNIIGICTIREIDINGVSTLCAFMPPGI